MWFQWWRQLNTEIDSRRNADFLQSAALDKIQLYIFSQSPVFTRTYKSHSADKNPVTSASLKLSHISMMKIFPIRKLKQTSQERRTVLENYSLFIYKKFTYSVELVAANFIKWERLLSNTSRVHRKLKGLFRWSGGPRSSGVGYFCFHALGDTKQKKPTPLDWGPPLHVNRV